MNNKHNFSEKATIKIWPMLDWTMEWMFQTKNKQLKVWCDKCHLCAGKCNNNERDDSMFDACCRIHQSIVLKYLPVTLAQSTVITRFESVLNWISICVFIFYFSVISWFRALKETTQFKLISTFVWPFNTKITIDIIFTFFTFCTSLLLLYYLLLCSFT